MSVLASSNALLSHRGNLQAGRQGLLGRAPGPGRDEAQAQGPPAGMMGATGEPSACSPWEVRVGEGKKGEAPPSQMSKQAWRRRDSWGETLEELGVEPWSLDARCKQVFGRQGPSSPSWVLDPQARGQSACGDQI